jgi:hypothetical protein
MEDFITNLMVDVDGRYEVPVGQRIVRNDVVFEAGDKVCLAQGDVFSIIDELGTKTVRVYEEPTDDFFGVRAKTEHIV